MKSTLKLFFGTAALSAALLAGCFPTDAENTPAVAGQDANLVLSMGVKDVNNLGKPGLAKSSSVPTSSIVLSKLIVTLTSSIGADAVIRDTIVAHADSDFVPTSTASQQILKTYSIKPLRNWVIEVKTLDVNDSVIHISSDTADNVKAGELRTVVLNLTSKYVVYAAKFFLPDSIGSQDTNVTQKQKLYVNRFVMVVDGDTVRDTTSSPAFFAASPDSHTVVWNYVLADTTHELELYVYADSLGNWNSALPIYGDTIHIASTDTTYAPQLPWMGPGSPHDPNYDPENPNQGGAQAGLTINIGAVGLVNVTPGFPTKPLPKQK